MNIQEMANHYIAAALWSSIDDNGQPYDEKYSISNLTKTSRLQVEADCKKFIELAGDQVENWGTEQLGHDFWLSRNGHGAGFFDRTHIAPKHICDALQAIARGFGSADIMPRNKAFFWICS